MSNGAEAAKGNAARAAASAAPRGPLTAQTATQHDAGLTELLFDDPMDADSVLEASQISQTQIIERQAESIARLERHAARDKEYRTVTKVKLKEAAARLKEYRLRVEALMGEVDAAKAEVVKLEGEKKKALAQAQAAKKKAAVVPPPEPKKPEMKTIGVQTPWKKALRTVSVQTMAVKTCDVQTQAEIRMLVGPVLTGVKETAVSQEKAIDPQALVLETLASANGVSASTLATATSAFDAIGAVIDAELEFSDDDEEMKNSVVDRAKQPAGKLPVETEEDLLTTPLVLDDVISQEIDKELEFSSSSSEDSSDDGSDDAVKESPMLEDGAQSNDVNVSIPLTGSVAPSMSTSSGLIESVVSGDGTIDAVAAAIDAELASDSEDGAESDRDPVMQLLVQGEDGAPASRRQPEDALVGLQNCGDALPLAMPLSLEVDPLANRPGEVDCVSAAIDAELASSSEDEGEEAGQPQLQEEPRNPILNPILAPKGLTFHARKTTQAMEPSNSPLSGGEASNLHSTPAVSSRATDASIAGESITLRRSAEQTIREKSRTLSLSSDSSSRGSSDDETSEVVTNTQPLDPPVELLASTPRDGISSPAEPIEKAVAPIDKSLDLSSVEPAPFPESRKRRESVIAPVGTTTEGEPNLKKRKRSLSEEKRIMLAPASASVLAPPHKLIQDALRHHPKLDVSGGDTSAIDTLTPRDLVAFKVAIALQAGEDLDSAYVTRTLGILVKHTAALLRAKGGSKDDNARIASNPHAIKLSKMLVKEHSQRQIGLDLLLEGMLRIFRTPRTRHAIERSIVQLTSLFQMVLFLRLRIDDVPGQSVGDNFTTDMVPDVHEVLLSIRDLVVTSRLKDGLVLPETEGVNTSAVSIAASSFRSAPAVSYDKAFLGHAAAFYTAICRALNRFDLPLVLIVDILKGHPNIKGLYCASAIVQVDPRVLRKQWDTHGHEQASAVRAVIVHIMQVITYQSRDKQEMVFKESALMLLSSIAEWIDDPFLASIGPPGNVYEMEDKVESFAAMLWRDHIARCITDAHRDAFDAVKPLELLASFHGDSAMIQYFPIKRFLAVISSETMEGTSHRIARIARLIGAVAGGTSQSSASYHDARRRGASCEVNYLTEAVRWMLEVCPRDQDGNEEELIAVVGSLADLLIGISTHETRCKQRDEWLRELLRILSPQHLHRLTGEPLRLLRLLVTAARPLITT